MRNPGISASWLRSLPAALTMALMSFLALSAAAADPIVGTASVIDAGTIKINGQKIRLYGIDAPVAEQACLREAKPWKCGAAAAGVLSKRLNGHIVKCEPVESGQSSDMVAKCTAGEDELGALLVREGWAYDFPKYSQGEYADEQKEAQRARRGLWATESDNPEEVRRQRNN